jgi:hypothetical protein
MRSTGRRRSGSRANLHRFTKILLRDNAVLDCPDHEGHVARQVRQMVFAPVAFFELLEMHEGVVPGVEEEVLLPALPIIGPVRDGPGSQYFGDRFQELERNQIEARLAVCAPGAAGETPNIAPVFRLDLAHFQIVPQRW